MDVITTLIADGKSPIAVQPGESALNHPPVSAQLLAALHPFTCYAALDPSLAQRLTASRYVIRFVTMPLLRALSRASFLTFGALDRLNAVYHLLEHHTVMDVSTSQCHRKRYSFGFDHNMAFRARFALICGVAPNRSGFGIPLFTPLALTVSLSRLALDQSILSASPRRSSNARCRERHTPAVCQSRSLRQQVTPLPQPISCGSISQGKPLLSTKMMPVRAAGCPVGVAHEGDLLSAWVALVVEVVRLSPIVHLLPVACS